MPYEIIQRQRCYAERAAAGDKGWITDRRKEGTFLQTRHYLLSVAAFVLGGCAARGPINLEIPTYDMKNSPISKGGVTITAEYYGFERLQKANIPISKDPSRESDWYISENALPEGEGGRKGGTWVYPARGSSFSDLQQTIFQIVVKNDTEHILRMNDARVVLALGDETESPLTKDQWMASLGQADKWTAPTQALIRRVKVLNAIGAEVMPGFTLKGYLVFDVPPTRAAAGTLTFFDVTTKVDASGNPVEKQRYDFILTPRTEHITVQ